MSGAMISGIQISLYVANVWAVSSSLSKLSYQFVVENVSGNGNYLCEKHGGERVSCRVGGRVGNGKEEFIGRCFVLPRNALDALKTPQGFFSCFAYINQISPPQTSMLIAHALYTLQLLFWLQVSGEKETCSAKDINKRQKDQKLLLAGHWKACCSVMFSISVISWLQWLTIKL